MSKFAVQFTPRRSIGTRDSGVSIRDNPLGQVVGTGAWSPETGQLNTQHHRIEREYDNFTTDTKYLLGQLRTVRTTNQDLSQLQLGLLRDFRAFDKHKLEPVLDAFGGDAVAATYGLQNAAQALANRGAIKGVFEARVGDCQIKS